MTESLSRQALLARQQEILGLVTHNIPEHALERALHLRFALTELHESGRLPRRPDDQLIGWYYAACNRRMGRKDGMVLNLVIGGHFEEDSTVTLDCIRKNGLVDSEGDLIAGAEEDVREWIIRFANSRQQLFVA